MLAIKDDCKLHLLSIQTRIMMRIDSKEIKTAKKSGCLPKKLSLSDKDPHIKKRKDIYHFFCCLLSKKDLSSDFDKHIKPKTRSIYNGNGNNTNLVIY